MIFEKFILTLKRFLCLCLFPLALNACTAPDVGTSAGKLKAPSTDYYMTYKVNGRTVTLDVATVKTFKDDIRYIIDGSSTTQGDIDVVLINHLIGPPRVGTFITAPKEVIFVLGNDEGNWSTFNMETISMGSGTFTMSEVTDTYAKGSFEFVADWGGEDAPDTRYVVTNGLFKVKILRF